MTPIKMTFDVKFYKKVALEEGIRIINDALPKAKKFAESQAPVDSGDYIDSFEIEGAKVVWNTVVWTLKNTDNKATLVENWWRKTPVVWSKKWWNPIVEVWIWAKVFRKTQDFVLKELKKK